MPRSAWTARATGAKVQRGKSSTPAGCGVPTAPLAIECSIRSHARTNAHLRPLDPLDELFQHQMLGRMLEAEIRQPTTQFAMGAPCSSGGPDSAPHAARESSAAAGGHGEYHSLVGPRGPHSPAGGQSLKAHQLAHRRTAPRPAPRTHVGVLGRCPARRFWARLIASRRSFFTRSPAQNRQWGAGSRWAPRHPPRGCGVPAAPQGQRCPKRVSERCTP